MEQDTRSISPELARLASTHGAPLRIDARFRVGVSPERLFAVFVRRVAQAFGG